MSPVFTGLLRVVAPDLHNFYAALVSGGNLTLSTYYAGAWVADIGTLNSASFDASSAIIIIGDSAANVADGSLAWETANGLKVWDPIADTVYTYAGTMDGISSPRHIDGWLYWFEVDTYGPGPGDFKLMKGRTDLTSVSTVRSESAVNYHASDTSGPVMAFDSYIEMSIAGGGDGDGGHLRVRLSLDGVEYSIATGDVVGYLISGTGLEPDAHAKTSGGLGLYLTPSEDEFDAWDVSSHPDGWDGGTPITASVHWTRVGLQPLLWGDASAADYLNLNPDGSKVVVYDGDAGRAVVASATATSPPPLEVVDVFADHPTLAVKPDIVFLTE